MRVSAIIATRGDVDLAPIIESFPSEWQRVVYNNGANVCSVNDPDGREDHFTVRDFAVYGRYAAIEFAGHDLIYVQDDDCIVSDPQAIVDAWVGRWQDMQPDDEGSLHDHSMGPEEAPFLVANMPPEFRHDGYTDSCLIGFGACFHRDAPARAFDRFWKRGGTLLEQMAVHMQMPLVGSDLDPSPASRPMVVPPPVFFQRTCDVVFTCLTPRVLVDVPKVNREFAEDEGRMYRTPGHVEERRRMLELARKVRDGR